MQVRLMKKNKSNDFLKACERIKISETEKTITVVLPLSNVQKSMLESGQLKSIILNIESWIY